MAVTFAVSQSLPTDSNATQFRNILSIRLTFVVRQRVPPIVFNDAHPSHISDILVTFIVFQSVPTDVSNLHSLSIALISSTCRMSQRGLVATIEWQP